MSDPPLLVLDATRLGVEPGGDTALGLRLRNQATVVDELELQVLGPAAEWAEVEPPKLSLFPGTDGRATVRFRPPRSPALASGPLAVGVRAVSKIDASRAVVEECQLDVGAFRDVAAELRPQSSRGRLRGRHEVRLTNSGNVPADVSLEAAELDGSCRVTVEPGKLALGPGQVSRARVTVRPSRTLWFGSAETYAFGVRAVAQPDTELKLQGSMRQGPLVPRAAAAVAVVAIAAVALAAVLLGRGALPNGAARPATPTPVTGVANAAAPLGEAATTAPAAASPSAPTPASKSTTAAGPTTQGGTAAPVIRVTAAPPTATPDTLPWPSPADCIPYDPTNLVVRYNSGAAVWQVISGNLALLAFQNQADANDGMALARRYTQQCFIGRSNTCSNRYQCIMDYWLGPSGLSSTIAVQDCIPYDRNQLSETPSGADWQVSDPTSIIGLFSSRADADAAVMVLRHTTNICYVGRDQTGPNRLVYITNYFS